MRNLTSIFIATAVLLIGPSLSDAAEPLRDPTRPYSARSVAPSNATTVKVSAIFVSVERRIAIVNGKRVTEGDRIGAATVIEILNDRLRMNLHGKEVTARLLPDGLGK